MRIGFAGPVGDSMPLHVAGIDGDQKLSNNSGGLWFLSSRIDSK